MSSINRPPKSPTQANRPMLKQQSKGHPQGLFAFPTQAERTQKGSHQPMGCDPFLRPLNLSWFLAKSDSDESMPRRNTGGAPNANKAVTCISDKCRLRLGRDSGMAPSTVRYGSTRIKDLSGWTLFFLGSGFSTGSKMCWAQELRL